MVIRYATIFAIGLIAIVLGLFGKCVVFSYPILKFQRLPLPHNLSSAYYTDSPLYNDKTYTSSLSHPSGNLRHPELWTKIQPCQL